MGQPNANNNAWNKHIQWKQEKGKSKRYTEDYKLDAIPFMPSQITLIKSLTLAFKIIRGHLAGAGIKLENIGAASRGVAASCPPACGQVVSL